ncbi:MAG: hydroxylase [Stutzerimonas stutzeri]|nr:MAG: hydroxylase [Stutzerimonas stutzeri]
MTVVRRPKPNLDPDVENCLTAVIEPTVGLNVVDLGMIYKATCSGSEIAVALTMTSPASPLREFIVDEVRAKLADRFRDTSSIAVELVWQPPWDADLITDRGCEQLGRPFIDP